jgi:type IV fimbrial biogenesis protein FimT
MKRRTRGFTLMELMITLALAAVIFGLGVPAFRNFAQNGRLTGAANDMLVTIIAARNEAVRRQGIVSFCPSTTPASTTATCTGTATQGYISFVDVNGDCQRNGADEVIANMSIHSEVTSKKNTTCISFGPSGFRRLIAGQPTTSRALYCDSRGLVRPFPASTDSVGRGVETLPTGRASVSRVYTELNNWNAGGNPVTCP